MFRPAGQVRNESDNKRVTVEQCLVALNQRILLGQKYCRGQLVPGGSIDLAKLNVKCIPAQEQQNMSMALFHLHASVAKPNFEFLFMCYVRSEDPFNDNICARQVTAIFQNNPIYIFLRNVGLKFIILSPSKDQTTEMVSVLAVVDNKQLVENYANIKESWLRITTPVSPPAAATPEVPETDLQNAITALNYALLREKNNCKGVWKLGNRFIGQGEVTRATDLAQSTRIRPMAFLKLRCVPDYNSKKDVRTLCDALKSAKAPVINADAKEFAAYQTEYLDPLFVNNPYYQFLKKAGIRFVVDVDTLDASTAKPELFIPVKVIVTDNEFIRQLSNECKASLSSSQSKSVIFNKRSFLIYLSLLLSDDKWDEFGHKPSLYQGISKCAPDHIVTMRGYLTAFSLDKDDNVNVVFDLINTVVMGIEIEQTKSSNQTRSFSNLLSHSILSTSMAAVGIGRHPEVTKLYIDLREAVMAISGVAAAATRAIHSI